MLFVCQTLQIVTTVQIMGKADFTQSYAAQAQEVVDGDQAVHGNMW